MASPVREKLQASRPEMIYRQHQQAHPISIMVGDTVMKCVPERHSKLSAKFNGPFVVVDKLLGNKFKLLDQVNNLTEVVHVDRLKKVSVPCPAPTMLPTDAASVPPPSTVASPNDYRL